MPLTETLKSTWSRFFASVAYEKDPGFRDVMLRLSRRGMLLAGVLGIVLPLAYVGLHAATGRVIVLWDYSDPRMLALWDKLLVIGLSLIGLSLSRTQADPRWGRLVVAAILLVISIASLFDDVASQDISFSAGWLGVFMLVAVGTMPYHPWQAFTFSSAITGAYFLCIRYAPALLGIGRLEFDTGQSFFIVIISLICTSISWLLYNNRYEQYQTLRRAEQLKEQLEKAYRSLEESLQLLTETQDQLIHAEKMASLGQIAAGIAHEMRNPLNFINNFAEILVELSRELRTALKAQKDKRVGEVLEDVEALLSDLEQNAGRINEHGKRAEGIVHSMIQHARSSSGERQATNLNALLEEHVKLAYHGMRAQQPGFTATMDCNYDDAVGHVELVPQEMGRVFINLLNNAFYAVHERARAGDGSFVARVQVSTRKAGDTVEIRVCDNGPGISEEVKDKVFEPFFTTKPTGSGTGLGLSLSYEIVVQGHHGQMTVESKSGQGATFIVTLPA